MVEVPDAKSWTDDLPVCFDTGQSRNVVFVFVRGTVIQC